MRTRRLELLAVSLVVVGLLCPLSRPSARHGEEEFLTNRIPEPAPYVVEETTSAGGAFGAPHTGVPFEPLWNGTDDVGSCASCHTTLYDEWRGGMMSNSWRDPGWRGAFLYVARATSTNGDCDIPLPPDGTPKARINPFGNANCTSTFNSGTTNVTYTGAGSLADNLCSRCHMPTNYIDAVTRVTSDPPSGQEHGRISPLYNPTAIGSSQGTDPFTGLLTYESFGQRSYVDGVTRVVNSNSGKIGDVCEVCHTNVGSRYTPFHFYSRSGTDYFAAPQNVARWSSAQGLASTQQDMLTPPDAASPNLGYAVGAGAYRLSPHALNLPERFGPLSWNNFSSTLDGYVSDVFTGGNLTTNVFFTQANPPGKHDTFQQVKYERSEFCAACHDVTNPFTIKNPYGFWVGGFPIERTYTEWRNSRYADRPGNANYDPNYKRDCLTCHMQQTYGQPGTATTLYTVNGSVVTPKAPLSDASCDRITHNPGFSHHFVGGNAYITKLIGANVDGTGNVMPYPELLYTSFSSADPNSRFHYARFDTTASGRRAGNVATQHERFAWDRLRNVLSMSLAPSATSIAKPATESLVSLTIQIRNDGAGHKFPTGFPEGRAAWVHVRAWDTRNTADTSDDVELQIQDSAYGNRRSLGVGYLTSSSVKPDPTYPADCPDVEGVGGGWKIPEGSIDPYAPSFKAMATLDGRCPTLDLPYATPVNLVVNALGLPVDANGVVIDRNNPTGLPRYTDPNGNGDLFDDSFLRDTRLQPRAAGPAADAGSQATITRFSIVVPSSVVGPIAVTAIVYYQSFEGIVAKKFLGNLANTDDVDANEGHPGGTPTLEPCVLKGACDRIGKPGPTGEVELRAALKLDPVVVEGAPPVPVAARAQAIQVIGTTDNVPPRLIINNCLPPRRGTAACNTSDVANIQTTLVSMQQYPHWSPSPYGGPTGNFAVEGYGEQNVDHARIIKVSFTEPVTGVDGNTFYVTDGSGNPVNFMIDQIDATTWALFPYVSADQSFLAGGGYVIHVAPSRNGSTIRDFAGNALPNGPAAGGEYTFGFKAS
jgi:hypothetical protein